MKISTEIGSIAKHVGEERAVALVAEIFPDKDALELAMDKKVD